MTAVATAPAVTRSPAPARRRVPAWPLVAAAATAAAGGLHVAAAAEHVGAGELAVGFFLLTAFAQLGLAAWLVVSRWAGASPSPQLIALALIGTVGLIGLYLVAHTTTLLDAFAIPHDAAGGHEHAGGSGTGSHIDPATGVDFSAGMATTTQGPVAMDGEEVAVQHAPGLLGTATVSAEVLAMLALTALLPATWRGRALNALLGLGGLTWVLWFTGVIG